MFELPAISARINADIMPIEHAFENVSASSDEVANKVSADFAKVDKAIASAGKANGGGGVKGFIGELKGDFGKTSSLGQIAKLAAGGGAILGIGLITGELKQAAEMGAKLADSLRSGDGQAQAIAVDFAKSIPILGGIFSAGQSIREMLTGEQAAINKINADAKELEGSFKAVAASVVNAKAEATSFEVILARLRAEMQHPGRQFEGVGEALNKMLGGNPIKATIEQVGEEINKQFGDKGIDSLAKLREKVMALRMDAQRQLPATSGHAQINRETDPAYYAALDARKKAIEELSQLAPMLSVAENRVKAAQAASLKGIGLSFAVAGAEWVNLGKHVVDGIAHGVKGEVPRLEAQMFEINERIKESLKDLTLNVRIAKMDDPHAELAKWIAGNPAATFRQITEAKNAFKQIADDNYRSNIQSTIDAGMESLTSPLDRFKEKIEQIEDDLRNKKITGDQADKLSGLAQHDYDQSKDHSRPETMFPGFFGPNSADAAKLQFSLANDKVNRQDKMEKIATDQLNVQKGFKGALDAIAKKLHIQVFSANP